ncbi:MAG TPA: hypothetical protein VFR11_09865 [Micromonosporaceae bacterium]|jgi:hypothetical protein|nr:hypothetical protein [Micromonosporaceae bacterium]
MRYRYVAMFVLCISVAVAAVIVSVTVTMVRTADRKAEWAHGGDGVTLAADLRLVDKSSYAATVVALGGPSKQQAVDATSLVVRVRWSGPDRRAHDGYYDFVVLSQSGGPTLQPSEAWAAGVDVGGFGWGGSYEPLSQHYPWLAGTSYGDGSVPNTSLETGVPAAATGSLTIVFAGEDLASDPDAMNRLVVGVFYERDGEVRWAKQIPVDARS